MGILGVGNPAPGAGQTLNYLGGRTWAGWSGVVTATDGTNGILFSFRTPNQALITKLSVGVNHSGIDAGASFGFIISMDGIVIFKLNVARSSNFGSLDIDPVDLVFPAQSLISIESITNDASAIEFTACLTCEQIGD